MAAHVMRVPARAAVDLHLHTRYSDGTWLPSALFDFLEGGELRRGSVADHHHLAHFPEGLAPGAERGIGVIAGTEVTTVWRDLPAHLLCYAPLPDGFVGAALSEVIDDTTAQMRANTQLIYDTLLARGYTFPRQAELLADLGGTPVRARDVAALLVGHDHTSDMRGAMRIVTEAGYQQICAPIEQAVAAAHSSGAVCLLAHPGRGEGEINRYTIREIEGLLAEIPLDGIEVYYPTHTPEQVMAYGTLAQRHHLLMSAGSDSHGPSQRLPISCNARRIAPLLERLGVKVR